jgi:hypothetical protein
VTLPDLALQSIYARLAWGVVLAAMLVAASTRWSSRRGALSRTALLMLGGLALAVMWLPGPASPAFWLGLVFSYPSVMLIACCAVNIGLFWGRSGMPPNASGDSAPASVAAPGPALNATLAATLAIGGSVLYADSAGWLALQIYARGFETPFAPATALVIGAVAVGALRSQVLRPTGTVLLVCVMAFTLARLPSGNLFDALLDPMMWCWAVGVSLRALRVRLHRSTVSAGSHPL